MRKLEKESKERKIKRKVVLKQKFDLNLKNSNKCLLYNYNY